LSANRQIGFSPMPRRDAENRRGPLAPRGPFRYSSADWISGLRADRLAALGFWAARRTGGGPTAWWTVLAALGSWRRPKPAIGMV